MSNTVSDSPNRQTALQAALAQCRKAGWLLVAFGFAINLLYLVVPLYMIQVFDRVLSSQRVETLLMLTLIAGIALLVLGLLETVRTRIQIRMANWLDRTTSGDMIRASVNAALAGYPANAQAVRDLGTIRGFITSSLRTLLDVPWSPIFVLALWLLHPWLGWFAAGCTLTLLVLAIINELAARQPAQQASGARTLNENLIEQAIRNADVLRAMGMLNRLVRNWDRQNDPVLENHLLAGDRNAVLFGVTRFARLFAQVGVLGLGAYLVIHAELTPGGMIAGSILLTRALAPIEQFMGAWRSLVSARAAHERLTLLTENMREEDSPMTLPAPKGALSCEDVWFSPRLSAEPTLKGIGFELNPGKVLALMGPSASGKTTLCKVLVGSWKPAKGHVRLDGADVHRWDPENLGPHVGYLPQDVELFAASVKENISRLETNPNPDDIVAAAKAAGVHEMLLSLPQGYDTVIGPGGIFLSGGQRQRIGLARALYAAGSLRPRLIILDEPNANLDTQGDDALVDAIKAAKAWGATVVLVTHDIRLLRTVDSILVLNEGRQQMFGGRAEVLHALRPSPVRIAKPPQAEPCQEPEQENPAPPREQSAFPRVQTMEGKPASDVR